MLRGRLAADLMAASTQPCRFQQDLVLAAGDHFAARVYALAAAELEAHSRTGPDWAACAKEIVDSNLESNTPFLSVH